MSYSTLNSSEKLIFASEAINIALTDNELASALSIFGYTPERLSEGLALQESVTSLDISQKVEYGERIGQTAVVNNLRDRVDVAYRTDRGIARRVLRSRPGIAEQLRLKEKPGRKRDTLIVRSRHLYKELIDNPATRAYLEPFNFTLDVLNERLADVEALAAAMQDQQVKRAEAKIATRKRRDAMSELDLWMAQFIAVARQVFRGDKEQLDKLGING